MNILYVVNSFPPGSFIVNEIHELTNRGHNISIFSYHERDNKKAHEELSSLDIDVHYQEPLEVTDLPNLLSRKIINRPVLARSLFFDTPRWHAIWWLLSQQISTIIERDDIDHVHTHFAVPKWISTTYAAAYNDITCTVTGHAYELFRSPDVRKLRRFCDLVDRVIVPSHYNKRHLFDNIQIDNEVEVVPATTRVEKFDIERNEQPGRILTVANLVEKKGHKYAIDAVAILRNRGFDVEYHIVGEGDRLQFLREYARDREIEDAVRFLGFISDRELRQEYREASVFILPSVIASDGDRDAMPVVLKEAMAARVPCVSTTVSAIPELIKDGENGLLVRPSNGGLLADAIEELLEHPEKRERLAQRGHRTVTEYYDIQISVDKLEDIFTELQIDLKK